MSDSAISKLTQFDKLAQTYEGWFTTHLGAFVDRREKDLIVGLLQPKPEETILEVGSGTGYYLREVARSGARCIGIEPSTEMLSVAIPRNLENVAYVEGCGEALPFKDGCFDSLLYMTTLEFVQDVPVALQEAARVVRPDGHLVFGVLNGDGPWARARRHQGGLWSEARFIRAAELVGLLQPFGSVRMAYCVHVPPQLGWLPVPLLSLMDWLLRRLLPASGALIGAHVALRRQK